MNLEPPKPGEWRLTLPFEDYLKHPSIGSTSLRKIHKSPKAFWSALNDPPEPPTEAQRTGTLLHTAILEGQRFLNNFVVKPDFGDLRTKLAKETRDEWLANLSPQAIIVTQDDLDALKAQIDSVTSHKDAHSLLKGSETEVSGFFTDPLTGIDLKMRADAINFRLNALIDIKTTQDCSEEAFARSAWNYGYHFQIAMYLAGAAQISGKAIEFPAFIVVEKTPPYDCAVYVADDAMVDIGERKYRSALQKLAECRRTGKYPGVQPDGMTSLALPFWAIQQSQLE